MNTQKRHRLVGGRLDEVMKKSGKSGHNIVQIMTNLYFKDSTKKPAAPVLNEARKGNKNLPDYYIVPLSEVLKIEPGYLFGDDDFKVGNYEEYLRLKGKEEKMDNNLPELKEHAKVIELAGYYLKVSFNGKAAEKHPDGTLTETEYTSTVANDKYSASITVTAMRRITERVKRYAADLYDAEVLRKQTESYDTGEDFERERKRLLKKAGK